MKLRNAIGIDPDSKGFVCVFIRIDNKNTEEKHFPITTKGLNNFIIWIKKKQDIIIAIEGSNGQSKPIENELTKNRIIFYSFKPSDVSKFRKAVMGDNKNNEIDAESVARFSMALEAQGKLDNEKRVWFPDDKLRCLTRFYENRSKALTSEVNKLWKLLKIISSDLYLTLMGKNPEVDITNNILTNKGVLSLLIQKPDIGEWKNLSEYDFIQVMGKEYRRKTFIKTIKGLVKVSKILDPLPEPMKLIIKNSAEMILLMKEQMSGFVKELNKVSINIKEVKTLEEIRGFSTITACSMYAEIINIHRFPGNDNLASYAGIVRHEFSTGPYKSTKPNTNYNRRLKDIFMTAAKNYVFFNPDSHLAGYFKNLVKGGMSVTEARKRVARSLVRLIYKKLSSIEVEADNRGDSQKLKENDMAIDLSLTGVEIPGNIPPLSINKIHAHLENVNKNNAIGSG